MTRAVTSADARGGAADEHAVIEIGGLTDQAAAAAQAVRESLRQVSLAAAALALPAPTAG